MVLGDNIIETNILKAATLGGILVMTVEFIAFLFLLIGGLLVLHQRGALHAYQLVASVVFLVFAVWFVAVLLLGVWSPGTLRRLLSWLQRLLNRLPVSHKAKTMRQANSTAK